MSTGISMSSVNKIKELAESRDYSLALDILEHQDLTKSLSPQFIRICGEVYYENGRYKEARAALVKAHSMAPMGNKIIYSLIRVYLSMGLYSLVNTYYEIYKFNQNEKDAGTYRIEYLIAKAERKSYKELYAILISANELETNDIWDFEMLVLYAAMKNEERYKMESEMFRANYKGSSYISGVDELDAGTFDIEAAVYCYPNEEQPDPEDPQEEIRVFEDKVLGDDYLRMHPKDPKITLMVEDREPVSNSMKFKQMLVKSREKKENKKLQKLEEQESADATEESEKKKRFRFGRMSKKDEEATLEAIAEHEGAGTDREQLLNEIMQNAEGPDGVTKDAETETPEQVADDEVHEAILEEEEDVKLRSLDELSEQSFEEAVDDFDISPAEDYDAVLMVDPDVFDEPAEAEEIQPEEAQFEDKLVEEEEVQPEEEISEEQGVQSENSAPEEKTQPKEEPVEKEVQPEQELAEEEVRPEEKYSEEEDVLTEEILAEYEIPTEEAEFAEFADEPETAEAAERLSEEQETVIADEPSDEQFDIDVAIQSLDDYAFETEEWGEDSFEQAYKDDDVVEVDEVPSEDDLSVLDSSDAEQVLSEKVEIQEDESAIYDESEMPEELPDAYDEAVISESESEIYSETETPQETDGETLAIEEQPEIYDDLKSEEQEAEEPEEPEQEKTTLPGKEVESILKKPDFPVFKSSLFPDYHSGEPPVIEPESETIDIKEEYDMKMSENLKKEEALISEADELLARLGIELGTKYSSNTDYFHMHEDSFVKDIQPDEETSEHVGQDTKMSEQTKKDAPDDLKQDLKKDGKHAREKKYKLKNNSR